MTRKNGQGATANPEPGVIPDMDEQDIKFATMVMQGKTAAEAYREAFSVHHWEPQSVWAAASKLRNSDKVRIWIEQARLLGLVEAGCTFESHLNELERLKTLALKAENYGAAVQAEKIRGEVAGHKTEKVQLIPASPEQTLQEIAQISPQLAAQLAQQEGIDWQPDGEKPSGSVH